MDFKFVLPIICIHIDGQTNIKVNKTKLAILFCKNVQKRLINLSSCFFEFVPKSKAYNSGYD